MSTHAVASQHIRVNSQKTNYDLSYIDKFSLFSRYMRLLKKTLLSFFLSTFIHIGMVTGYYYSFLYFNPDDEGKKNFYSSTSVSPGINIGGRIVGGGGVQTNHHKSYLFHLVREHYKGLSKMFFIQFSSIYLLILVLLRFFPEREKLREDTRAIFNLNYENSIEFENRLQKVKKVKPKQKVSSTIALRKRLTNRKSTNKKETKSDADESYDEIEETEENLVMKIM